MQLHLLADEVTIAPHLDSSRWISVYQGVVSVVVWRAFASCVVAAFMGGWMKGCMRRFECC